MKKLLYSGFIALMMLLGMMGFARAAAPQLTLTGISNNQYGINVPIIATLTVDGVAQQNFELYYCIGGAVPAKSDYQAGGEESTGVYRIVASGTTAELFLTYVAYPYFKAIAYPAGTSTPSNLIELNLTALEVEAPEFNPAPQGLSIVEVDYGTPIKIIDNAGGAEIFYSLDATTEPRKSEWDKHNPKVFKYDDNEGIKITGGMTIFAIAYKEVNGQLAGSVRIRGTFKLSKPRIQIAFSRGTYVIGSAAPTVNLTVPEGFTLGTQPGNVAIELTCPNNGFNQIITENGTPLDMSKADAAAQEDDWVIQCRLVKGDNTSASFTGDVELTPEVLSLDILKPGERPAVPVFSVPSGKVYKGTKVAITCATPGATILYTDKDGDINRTYTGELTITKDIAFRAMAEKDGLSSYRTGVAMAAYTVEDDPLSSLEVTVTPAGGSLITEEGTKITVTPSTTVDKICFKLYAEEADVDKDAQFNTTATEYSETVKPVPTEAMPIVRIGLVKDGTWKYFSYLYTFPKEPIIITPDFDPENPDNPDKPDDPVLEQVAKPVFSRNSGEVAAGTKIGISCTTPGAAIHYTLNGDEPTEASTLYSDSIEINATTTLKAIATKENWENSAVATATYTVSTTPVEPIDPDDPVNPEKVMLTFNPASGSTVDDGTSVSIGSGNKTVDIFYMMFSSLKEAQEAEWDQDQAASYNDEIRPVLDMENTTIKATYAVDDEHLADTFFYATYIIKELQSIELMFRPASGSVVEDGTAVTVIANNEEADIYYKVYADSMASVEDAAMFIMGSMISEDGNPVITKGNTFLKCGVFDNSVGTMKYFFASYKIKGELDLPTDTVAEPTFSLPSGEVEKGTKVAIACATEDAAIYYTVNGDEPMAISPLYSDSIEINGDMTIKAIALKAGMVKSKVAVVSYTVKPVVANENKALAGVSIYPNPNDGRFSITVPVEAQGEVFTANGQWVKRLALTAGVNTVCVENSGIYFVRVSANGQMVIKKVVVR